MAAPTNPFLPSDMGNNAPAPLELARDPRPPRAPEAAAADDLPAAPDEGARSTLTRTVPVVYTNPDGGIGRFILWGLAACGLAALVLFGARMLSRKSAPAASPAAEIAAETKPVTWKAVERGSDVLIRVEVTPRAARPNARLLLDGAPLASNPVLLPKGGTHKISATANGYEPATVELTADGPKTVALELKRAAKP
ncbi:MAG TPA: hypothetical protein VGG33_16170 [Polyangia bacterium]